MFGLVRRIGFVGLMLVFAASSAMRAQETLTHASVTGRVVDPAGAVVAHSAVTALAVATNQRHFVETDAQGRFRLPYLPAGEYRISAQAKGFGDQVHLIADVGLLGRGDISERAGKLGLRLDFVHHVAQGECGVGAVLAG